jgi:predicted protein tyrosine phosphatase
MKKVIVLGKRVFDKTMRDNNINIDNVEVRDKVAFISINDTFETDEKPFFAHNKKNVLVLFFDDVTEDMDLAWGKAKCFTKEQGIEVVDFLDKIKDADTLIVHCAAGVSRSGAVGKFAAEYLGVDYNEFRNANPRIHPNNTVIRILKNITNGYEA